MARFRERIVRRAIDKTRRTLLDARYSLLQLQHLRRTPPLTLQGERIVRQVTREGVAVAHLHELGLVASTGLQRVLPNLVGALNELVPESRSRMEYSSGFEHCIPLNPTQIARDFPELYLWGLDERLLDIVENLIGLPVAYHGVVVRKEQVDGRTVGTRNWHLDSEDVNIIRVMVYLSDVSEDDGPFEYVPKYWSPRYQDFGGRTPITDDIMGEVVPAARWRRCTGLAGTVVFAAVARVFHHGRRPSSERMAASFCYTSREPRREELCRRFSFEKGLPLITHNLTERQLDSLWKYREFLPEWHEGRSRGTIPRAIPSAGAAASNPNSTKMAWHRIP